MDIIIGLVAELLLWEVLHNRQRRALLTVIFSRFSEVKARVLLLSLHHLDVAGHIVVFFLGQVLADDEGRRVLIVLFKRRGSRLCWSHWLSVFHV